MGSMRVVVVVVVVVVGSPTLARGVLLPPSAIRNREPQSAALAYQPVLPTVKAHGNRKCYRKSRTLAGETTRTTIRAELTPEIWREVEEEVCACKCQLLKGKTASAALAPIIPALVCVCQSMHYLRARPVPIRDNRVAVQQVGLLSQVEEADTLRNAPAAWAF